jgi:regulator-associated protein of mTOR
MMPGSTDKIICDWHQLSGVLYSSGASPIVKVWDADEEMCIQEISLESRVTSMCSDIPGNLLLSGTVSGTVFLFDRRVGPAKLYAFSF